MGMMLGIGKEASIFFYAVLTGVVTISAYRSLFLLRKLIPHHIAVVNAEDFLYWLGISAYIFRQMYQNNIWKYTLVFRAWCRSWKYPGIFYQNFS